MWDVTLFNWLYGLWQGSELISFLVRFVSIYVPWILGSGLLFWHVWKRSWRELFLLCIFAATSFFVVEFLKRLVNRPRPFVLFSHLNPLFLPGDTLAMPSAHALVFSTIATLIFFKNHTAGIILFFLVFCISVARVSAGVHWPSDVLVGSFIGVLLGCVFFLLEKKLLW